MRSSAARIDRDGSQQIVSDDALKTFTRELSELCRKHGLGITGDPFLFVMENEDHLLEYRVDNQSKLVFE